MSYSTERAKPLILNKVNEQGMSFIRLSKDITQKTGVPFSPQWLHRITKDTTKELTFIRIEALAKYFNVPITHFTQITDEKMIYAQNKLNEALELVGASSVNFRGGQLTSEQLLEVAQVISETVANKQQSDNA